MNYVELPPAAPAEEIARDEAAFLRAEETGEELLRFWEPKSVVVVLGRGNLAEREVCIDNCRADGVPVLRRSSGGGAVVLMPGCLCYSLVLDREGRPELFSASATNQRVMAVFASALTRLTDAPLAVHGDSDLVMHDRKIAGHAQRRGRRAILFHGCLLLDADLDLIGRYLRQPSRSPDYRHGRSHGDFVTNTGWSGELVRRALKECELTR